MAISTQAALNLCWTKPRGRDVSVTLSLVTVSIRAFQGRYGKAGQPNCLASGVFTGGMQLSSSTRV
jgi:hypothetical protein